MTTTFKGDFYAVLNVTGVTNLVEDRIYPGVAKQGARAPYIVWQRAGGDPMATIAGSGNRTRPTVRVFACAEEFDEAAAIAEAVRAALKAAHTTSSGKLKCNSVGLAIDGFDEGTRLLTVAIEASLSHTPA